MTDTHESFSVWYPYESGATIGQPGFEGGIIGRDEEYGDPDDSEDADARLTLESETGDAHFLTATLYGWLSETRRYSAEAEVMAVFDLLKPELARLAALIPDEEDQDIDALVGKLTTEIRLFTARHFSA